ncbi:MAG: hypothetical protein ACI846_001756, partial [Pseudoalteromonas distincta]
AKLRFVQHPCCKLLIINSVSGVITGSWSVLVDWCLFSIDVVCFGLTKYIDLELLSILSLKDIIL